jgi:hypothetical protein
MRSTLLLGGLLLSAVLALAPQRGGLQAQSSKHDGGQEKHPRGAPIVSPMTLVFVQEQPPKGEPEVNPKVLAFLKPVAVEATDTQLQKLLKERHNVAAKYLQERVKQYKEGIRDLTYVFDAVKLVVQAKLDLATDQQARIEVFEETVAVTRLAEEHLSNLADELAKKKITMPAADLELARYARLCAEVELHKEKEKAKAGAK